MCFTTPTEVSFNASNILAGTKLDVIISKNRPQDAILKSHTGKSLGIVSVENLYRLFPGDFVQITDEMIEEAILDVKCVSIKGEDVEPDGYDSNGYPSILIAKGLI